MKYFPIELQSIHFSGILKKISVFLRKNLVRLMCRRFFWNIFFQMKMVQEVHETICSSKTISFRSFGIFTHWSPANTVTSLPQKGRFGQNFWWKILLGWCAADFSDRHSFRWKWFRTYLRPFLVKKQQLLGHMKYSPIDLQPIPWPICLKTDNFVNNFERKSRKGDQAQIFLKDILLGENGSGLT